MSDEFGRMSSEDARIEAEKMQEKMAENPGMSYDKAHEDVSDGHVDKSSEMIGAEDSEGKEKELALSKIQGRIAAFESAIAKIGLSISDCKSLLSIAELDWSGITDSEDRLEIATIFADRMGQGVLKAEELAKSIGEYNEPMARFNREQAIRGRDISIEQYETSQEYFKQQMIGAVSESIVDSLESLKDLVPADKMSLVNEVIEIANHDRLYSKWFQQRERSLKAGRDFSRDQFDYEAERRSDEIAKEMGLYE